MDSKTKKILEDAANLVEKGFARGAYARDSFGEPCHENGPTASKFCMVGAIHRAEFNLLGIEFYYHTDHVRDAMRLCRQAIGSDSIISVSDRSTQEEVVAYLRAAAAKAE